MVCPYCGQVMDLDYSKEHFYPKSVYPNDWDFLCCTKCNIRKNNHIVYPTSNLFEVYPTELSKKKNRNLWRMSGWGNYNLLVPWRQMRDIFHERSTYYTDKEFLLEEQEYFEFDKVRRLLLDGADLVDFNKKVQAVVLSRFSMSVLVLHNYEGKVYFGPNYMSMKVEDYIHSNLYGILVCGSGENGVWKTTISDSGFFKNLMR